MKTIFYSLNGVISIILYFVNTVFWFFPLMLFSLLKLLPLRRWQALMSLVVDALASFWISFNNINQKLFSRTKFIVNQEHSLSRNDWYLVIANHQSWVDILTLQRVFNKKIPFLKFFLKKNLIYVPFLGLCWWGLDFPFMQRYSRSYIEKHPHLKGKDLETTKQACEKFKFKPVSVMNFVEGTRYSIHKIKPNDSFQRLLKPRSGGVAFVLSAMGQQLNKLVDVTIYYPGGIPTYWDFVCGKVKKVIVQVDTFDISYLFNNGIYKDSYFTNDKQKRIFQDWLNQLWSEKEQKLMALEQEYKR